MLYVILAILLLTVLILSISIRFHIQYLGGAPAAFLKVLFFRISLYPSAPKEEKKKSRKKKEPKRQKKALKDEEKKKRSLSDVRDGVGTVIELLSELLEKFLSTLTITTTRIYISVGSDNAAKTALLYGGICQGVSYLIELLDNVTKLKTNKNTYIHVGCDFSSEETVAEIRLILSMRVYQLISHGFRALKTFIKRKIKNEINNTKRTVKKHE